MREACRKRQDEGYGTCRDVVLRDRIIELQGGK